jgi:hypothetical protein
MTRPYQSKAQCINDPTKTKTPDRANTPEVM